MSPIDNLKKAFSGWFSVFTATIGAAPAYAQFASACYTDLVGAGVPSAEAAIMSVEILKAHLSHWFKREVQPDLQRQILENFVPRQEH